MTDGEGERREREGEKEEARKGEREGGREKEEEGERRGGGKRDREAEKEGEGENMREHTVQSLDVPAYAGYNQRGNGARQRCQCIKNTGRV